MEIDHLDHNHHHDVPSNLMLLHLHCHDERHSKLTKTVLEKKRPRKQKSTPESNLPEEYTQETWDAEMAVIKERIRKLEREGISIK